MGSGTSAGFGAALRVREFRYLWCAELLSVAGDQLARVALAVLVFARTSSAGLTALTYALTFLPAVVSGALLSGLADRFSRRRLLVVTDVVRAGLACVMAVPGLPLPVLWVVVGVLSAAAGPFKAAQLAILPQIIEDRETYGAANGLRQTTAQMAQLVSFAAGGVLLSVVEPHVALLLNALTFVASAVLIVAGVRDRKVSTAEKSTGAGGEPGRRGLVWPLFALAALVGLYVVPEGLAAPYAHELGAAAVGIGVLMAADPAGSALGGWLATRLPIPASASVVVLLAVAAGVPLAVCVVAPGLVWSAVLWAVSGVFSTIFLVRLLDLVVDLVPDHRRGGVMGRLATCLYCSQGVAILGSGMAAEVYGPFRAVAAAGVVAIGLAGVVGVWWWLARSRHERVAGNEQVLGEKSHHRSLLGIAGTSSPGQDCQPDPEAVTGAVEETVRSVGDQGSGGDASSPFTSATQSPTSSEEGRRRDAPKPGPSSRLCRLPRAARGYLVGVEAVAVVATVVLAVRYPVTARAAVLFAVIVGLGVLTAEVTRRIERMRRRFSDTPHVNMSSVWTLSAALVTTPALAAATAVLLYLHLWHRSWRRITGIHPFRVVFSVCAVVLSCHVAFVVDHGLPGSLMGSLPPDSSRPGGLLGLMLVIVAYWCVNSGLVAGGIAVLRRDRSLGRLLGSWNENSLEYATLSVGALTALLLSWYAWAVALVVFPLYVLHRAVLVRQLEHAATTDDKTGLLNAGTWRALASTELGRARRHGQRLGVLMVDVDFFKGVNDRYGHLVGDQALGGIAEAMRGVVRGADLVGRFGGEEFVILVAGVDSAGAVEIGDRIRDRVRGLRVEDAITGGAYPDLRLTVSIGVATFPDAGSDLDELLMKADAALFAAKDAGRDRVLAVHSTGDQAGQVGGRVGQEAGRSPL